jgi:hypothetical protein
MSKFMRKTILAVKVETTPGTDIVPAAADCVLGRNFNIVPLEMTYEERNLIRGFFGNFDAIAAIKKVHVTFEIEYQASGTAGTPAAYDGILTACGTSSTTVASTSVTYAPLSGTGKTVSLYYYIDGMLHKMVYGRGNATINVKANGIPYYAFDFIGLDTGATDTANITPSSFANYKTPLAANKANTPTANLFGVAVALESLTFNFGNQNQQVTRIGSEQVLHTDRKTVGSMMFEMTSVATKDWLTAVKTNALGAFSFIHGSVAGSILTLSASNLELQNPRYSDIQGIQMLQLDFRANPSAAGNDEFSHVHT